MAKPKNVLFERFNKEGYTTLDEFRMRTGCTISAEIARRAIYHGEPVSTPSTITIMHALGFTPDEIKNHLISLGEKIFSSLISGETRPPQQFESALIALMGRLQQEHPRYFNGILEHMTLAAEASGYNDVNLTRFQVADGE
jgi:hypothetical protein